MNARILRTAVPGAVFLAALSATGFAQTPPLAGQSPRQNQASPNPVTKQYALPYALNNHANPAATPTPAPGAVIVSGKLRGYSFDRVNHVQNASNPNRHSTEFGFEPHIDYRIGNTPLNIGYTYFGGTGFGLNGPNPIANGHVDNTLPGFPLDQPIHEAYIQYKDANNTFTFGDQELNYAWTPNSDSRIVPASYQGLDSSIKLTRTLTFGLTDILRFEQRNSSNFEPNTLLTAPYPQTSSLIAKSGTQTPGTLIIGLTYKPASNVNVTAQDYQFYDLANMIYVEGRVGLAPKLKANPYLATQLVEETSIGQGQIGIVRNQTIGAQLGATVSKGLLLAVSTDIAPWKYAFVRAKSATAAESGYFIPGGGTGAAAADGPGLYRVAYGGIASPYTDSLGTDPLYTSNITQGMADRRSAGNSAKIAAVYTTPNNQFKLIASEGYFQYSNAISRNITSEYNLDGTYFLNKVRANHPYHGLFVRVRYAPRTVPTLPYNFQYQRFQTEYDF
jgi:hypothetical protein